MVAVEGGVEVAHYFTDFFTLTTDDDASRPGYLVWTPFAADTTYFAPSTQPYMLNFRVDDLDGLLAQLKADGVDVDGRIEESEFGRFSWIMDPEGTRIELWQPPA